MSPIGDTYHRACLLECGDCPTSSVDIIEQSVLIALLPTLDPTTAREKEREGAESFPAFWFLPIEAMDPRPGAAGGAAVPSSSGNCTRDTLVSTAFAEVLGERVIVPAAASIPPEIPKPVRA